MMYTIGIVAHQARRDQALELAAQVDADYLSVDNGSLGCAANHRHVQHHLTALNATWIVVLEDDAQPVEGFREQLTQALPVAPSPIVSLYLGRLYPRGWQTRIEHTTINADLEDASWIQSTHLLHAVGYAIRTEHIGSLHTHPTQRPPDEHITKWAKRYGHTTAYTWPSLTDHADQPTLTDHRGQPRLPGRTAWNTGTRNQWATTTTTLNAR